MDVRRALTWLGIAGVSAALGYVTTRLTVYAFAVEVPCLEARQ